jgi:hypothetical protein
MSQGYTFEARDTSIWPPTIESNKLEWYPDRESLDKAIMMARLKGWTHIRYRPSTRAQHDSSLKVHVKKIRLEIQKENEQDFMQRFIDSVGDY